MSDKIIIKRNGVDLKIKDMVVDSEYCQYMIPLIIDGITYPLFPQVAGTSLSLSNKVFDFKPTMTVNPKNQEFFQGTFYKPNNFGILIKGIDISNYYTAPYRLYSGGSKPYNYTVTIPTNVKQLKVVVIGNGGGGVK